MKPHLQATIALAGIFVLAGTSAIVTAEYQVLTSGRDAVASLLVNTHDNFAKHDSQMVPRSFVLSNDSDPYGTDVTAKLESELKCTNAGPIVDVQVTPRVTKATPVGLPTQVRIVRRASAARLAPKAARSTWTAAPAAPVMPSMALTSALLPMPGKAANLPKGGSYKFILNGNKGVFRIDGLLKGGRPMVFDSKQFAENRKAMAMEFQMMGHPDAKTWAHVSLAELEKLKSFGVTIKGPKAADGRTWISVSPTTVSKVAADALDKATHDEEAAIDAANFDITKSSD
jgi:hypothetical protein